MFLVRSGAADGYDKLVNELGGNPVKLVRRAGLSTAQFRNPNTYIAYPKLAELLELGASACARADFGLLLASRQTSTVLGDLPLLLSRHRSSGAALDEINQYLYLHARGVRLEQREIGDEVELKLQFDISSRLGINQLLQLSIGHLANFTTDIMGLEKGSLTLHLCQEMPVELAAAGSRLPYPRVSFGAGSDSVRVPSRWLRKPSRWDEQALRSHLQDYLSQLEQRYPDNLPDQVREVAGRILPSGECSLERVAATLDLHPRVLQKRLKKLGSSYGDLLQQTRREIAEQHLRHGSMSITELALNLGYADVSVFSRHFRKWTGRSPRQWQQHVR
jgi:AraC-like DNA-binding protein